MKPVYPSVGEFSWYSAHEIFFASRRSTIVEMLYSELACDETRDAWEKDALGREVVPVIVARAEKVATCDGEVVGFGGVGECVIVVEENALLGEGSEGGGCRCVVEVRVLEPYLVMSG